MRGYARFLLAPGLPTFVRRFSLGANAPSSAALLRSDERLRLAVTRHVDLVWRVLRRAGLGPADAEDASQDVF